jgi:hypothetical protein
MKKQALLQTPIWDRSGRQAAPMLKTRMIHLAAENVILQPIKVLEEQGSRSPSSLHQVEFVYLLLFGLVRR